MQQLSTISIRQGMLPTAMSQCIKEVVLRGLQNSNSHLAPRKMMLHINSSNNHYDVGNPRDAARGKHKGDEHNQHTTGTGNGNDAYSTVA